MPEILNKSLLRRQLREKLAAMSDEVRHHKSVQACTFIAGSAEFAAARVVMLYLSAPTEVDTSPLALKAWQAGKTVVVPKVSWNQRRMLPVEINSLNDHMTTSGPGVREPIEGKPVPVDFIDFGVGPGLAFSEKGYRIGGGVGFYDRFLAQAEVIGTSFGVSFDERIVPELP